MSSADENTVSLGEGVVVENAVYGKESVILVAPIEMLPNMEGKLGINPGTYTARGEANGRSYASSVKTTSAVSAIYWNEDPNRATAPQVIKGERVILYRLRNDPAIYYKPLNKDTNKRVQETVTHTYAAKPKEDILKPTPTTPDNAYSQTWDGVNGMVEFRTSKANGEKAAWKIQMNGKDGVLVVTDGEGKVIQIDAVRDVIDVHNRMNSHVQLDKEVINIKCHDTVNMTADKTINIKTKTLNIECQEMNVKADKWNHQGSSVSHKADSVNWSIGSSITFDCPTINLNGQVNMGGMSVTGSGGSGNGSVAGSLSVSGPVSLNGGSSSGVIAGSYIDT